MDIESLSLSEAEYAALRSAEFDNNVLPPSTRDSAKKDSNDGKAEKHEIEEQERGGEEAEVVRSYDVKFPPTKSGLRIPRALFLCSAPSTPSPSSSVTKVSAAGSSAGISARRSARRRNGLPGHSGSVPADGKRGAAGGEGDAELAAQAQSLVHLMRRSIVLHEFKDRVLWDENADPYAASEERVQYIEVKNASNAIEEQEQEKEEERLVGEWLDGVE